MTTNLLTLYDVARACAAPRARTKAYRGAATGSLFSRPADTRHLPRLRARLECRWRIDPATGALTARWVDLSISASAGADVEPEPTGSRRCVRRSRQAASGLAACSPAARLAA